MVKELEQYNHIPGQAIEETSMRVCIICHSPITNAELKKGDGAWLPTGGLGRLTCHQSCLDEINRAVEERQEQEQQAEEATQFVRDLARAAQQQAVRKHR